jgi:hypothetical protein
MGVTANIFDRLTHNRKTTNAEIAARTVPSTGQSYINILIY